MLVTKVWNSPFSPQGSMWAGSESRNADRMGCPIVDGGSLLSSTAQTIASIPPFLFREPTLSGRHSPERERSGVRPGIAASSRSRHARMSPQKEVAENHRIRRPRLCSLPDRRETSSVLDVGARLRKRYSPEWNPQARACASIRLRRHIMDRNMAIRTEIVVNSAAISYSVARL